jgi:hypothetical protein
MKQPWLDPPDADAPPDDFSPRTDTRGLGGTAWALALALLVVAMLRSEQIASVAYDLPPWPGTETLIAAAEGWHAAMTAFGIADLAAALRGVKVVFDRTM